MKCAWKCATCGVSAGAGSMAAGDTCNGKSVFGSVSVALTPPPLEPQSLRYYQTKKATVVTSTDDDGRHAASHRCCGRIACKLQIEHDMKLAF